MAQKVNQISFRLKLNRSSNSSWFNDYYYGKLFYQDVNFIYYFSLKHIPIGNMFGFCLNSFITHHFLKGHLFVYFFRVILAIKTYKPWGNACVKLIKHIDDSTKIQQKEVKIWSTHLQCDSSY